MDLAKHQAVVLGLDHASGKLPEATEYVLQLLTPMISLLSDSKLDKVELSTTISGLIQQVEDLYAKKADIIKIISVEEENKNNFQSTISGISTLLSKVDRLSAALLLLASKIDTSASPESSCVSLVSETLGN